MSNSVNGPPLSQQKSQSKRRAASSNIDKKGVSLDNVAAQNLANRINNTPNSQLYAAMFMPQRGSDPRKQF